MLITKGNFIKLKRKEKKIKQEELADKVGINSEYLSRIENDKQNPSYEIIQKIASVLNFSLDEMNKETQSQIKDPPIPGTIQVKYTNNVRKYPILDAKIACGNPSCIAYQDIEDYIEFPVSMNINADFVFIAKGNSMEKYKIFDGYLVFVKKQENNCNPGEIVAICVNDGEEQKLVLKKAKYYKDELVFINGSGDIFEEKEINIIGKMVYLIPDPRGKL